MNLRTAFFLLSITLASHANMTVPDSLSQPLFPSPRKSETVAYSLAITGSLAPIIPLIEAGQRISKSKRVINPNPEYIISGMAFTLGPSLGQFYAGSPREGLIGCAIRAAGAGIFIIANNSHCYSGSLDHPVCPEIELLGLISFSLLGTGIYYSLHDTHYAVKRANENAKAQPFGFVPELIPSSNGKLLPGVMTWARF